MCCWVVIWQPLTSGGLKGMRGLGDTWWPPVTSFLGNWSLLKSQSCGGRTPQIETLSASAASGCFTLWLLDLQNTCKKYLKVRTHAIFSCPEQLNRWPCHWLTDWVTFVFWHYRVALDTWDLWDILSEWWGPDLTTKPTYLLPTYLPVKIETFDQQWWSDI